MNAVLAKDIIEGGWYWYSSDGKTLEIVEIIFEEGRFKIYDGFVEYAYVIIQDHYPGQFFGPLEPPTLS